MPTYQYLPIYELIRGDIVESVHYGAIAVVNASGDLIASYGDPHTITFMRSAAKPLQALPFIEQGGHEYYKLTSREIALLCASHAGTDEHVAVLTAIQTKSGVSESDLLCGVHPIAHKPTRDALYQKGEPPTANRHNCSGKHTGMVAFANLRGEPAQDYINPNHPVQKAITRVFSEMCSLSLDRIGIGIDGCSAPNFAVPLYNAALAIARLCNPAMSDPPLSGKRAGACRTITKAMLDHADMVGGPNSFDTHLMQGAQGRLLSKGGAEGYQVIGIMPGVFHPGSPGLGVAIKVSDGDLKSHTGSVSNPRGQVRPAVSMEILRQLGVLEPGMADGMVEFGPAFPVYNWRKLLTGSGRPSFQLDIDGNHFSPGEIQSPAEN
jgi:L-asparaginase II